MSQITEDVRIGLSLRDFHSFWEQYSDQIAAGPSDTTDNSIRWSRAGSEVILEPSASDGSTVVRISIESGEPRKDLEQLLERLSQALDDAGTVAGASFTIEPSAGEAPEEETSADQPL